MVKILCTARRENNVAHLYAVGTIETFTWIPPTVKDRVKECSVLEFQLENALSTYRQNGGPTVFCPTAYDWVEEFVYSLESFEDTQFELAEPIPYPPLAPGDVY